MAVMTKDYRQRMARCIAAALVVHVVLFAVPSGCPQRKDQIGATTVDEPLVLTLKQPEKPLRLIESGAATDEPVDPATDLISERNSKAQDMSDVEGSRIAPYVPTPSQSDELRMPDPSPEPPNPVQPESEPAKQAPSTEPQPPKEAESTPDLQITPEPAAPEPEPAPEDVEPERTLLAKADPSDQPAEAGQVRGRVDGGVKGKGFLSFEAMESEFAPYLREVRNRVERRWKSLIQLRYSGSSTTRAVIDCAIDSNGQLVHVTVVEAGDSASYAGLCKEAIERAGPFPPFPFDVPQVYRSKNLEIRWTFSFL